MLLRSCRKEGPHFTLTGASRGFSRAAARVGFLTRYDGELRPAGHWSESGQPEMNGRHGANSPKANSEGKNVPSNRFDGRAICMLYLRIVLLECTC